MPDDIKTTLPPRWFIRAAWAVHRGMYKVLGDRALSLPAPKKYGTLTLTTTGRRSGQPRPVILGYYLDGDDMATLAMNGWGAPEPAWWLNLQAQPDATVAIKGRTIAVHGLEATGDERTRLWDRWREIDTKLDAYAARRPTETAVVILRPR